eukprot:TRINITY_DN9011_c0_g1_i1.p1 TRINITY_DN9011_c0_g1~~TRINITY_DN9011_c0_g1_i1.p1  ORF type:complete len:274 (+),score=17.42 TRINITY_DN9011_c0_g1_i1:64-822(+)
MNGVTYLCLIVGTVFLYMVECGAQVEPIAPPHPRPHIFGILDLNGEEPITIDVKLLPTPLKRGRTAQIYMYIHNNIHIAAYKKGLNISQIVFRDVLMVINMNPNVHYDSAELFVTRRSTYRSSKTIEEEIGDSFKCQLFEHNFTVCCDFDVLHPEMILKVNIRVKQDISRRSDLSFSADLFYDESQVIGFLRKEITAFQKASAIPRSDLGSNETISYVGAFIYYVLLLLLLGVLVFSVSWLRSVSSSKKKKA